MICKNCGAIIKDNQTKCEYCGSINIIAAQNEYFEKLDDVKEDLQGLNNVTNNTYKNELTKTSRRAIRTFLVVGIILAVMFFGIFIINKISNIKIYGNAAVQEKKAELLWEYENLSNINQWYETGEFEKIQELVKKDDTDYYLYSWEHYDMYSQELSFLDFLELKQEFDNGYNLDYFDLAQIISFAIDWSNIHPNSQFTDIEKERLFNHGEEIKSFIIDNNFTSKENLENFIKLQLNEDYTSISDCYDFAEKILEE